MTEREYVLARKTLLDTLELLHAHSDAIVLIGAQAVYLHAPGGLAVPAYTTDSDLALDADVLALAPDIAQTLQQAGYIPRGNPGSWDSPNGVHIDLMTGADVPGGRRSAALPGHDATTARRTAGLEVAVADNEPMLLTSLDPDDPRQVEVRVASPAALVVAKLTKIAERTVAGDSDRVLPKDAGDLLRLLRMTDAKALGARLRTLRSVPALAPVIDNALDWARADLTTNQPWLTNLAVAAAQGTEPDLEIASAMTVLLGLLLDAAHGPTI
jgi:hypothetical protein